MKTKSKVILLVALLFLALFLKVYPFLDAKLENFLTEGNFEIVRVDRVIDGDTIESNKTSIRLLGINTPERGEYFYKESKDFLEELILNETVKLEFVGDKTDKYGRTLAYIFLQGENINVEMVEKGYGNYYFYSGMDKYSNDLIEAWDSCIENKINLCEPSGDVCANCVSIKDSYIINECEFSCDISNWIVKEEGRDKFVFSGDLKHDSSLPFDLDTSDSSGSLFLRDDEGGLVEWGM